MRRFFLSFIIILPSLLYPQENSQLGYTVSGKIIDSSTKEPLEFATVLFRLIDSSTVKYGGISNEKGKFSIDVSSNNYQVTIDFLSYKTKQIAVNLNNRDFDLGTIALELDTEFLSEIEIVGGKKTLELKPNKMVYNVAKDLTSNASNISDLLNNIPSVTVDAEGGITLRGQDATVMINNRLSSLSKSEALKSIPAASIEEIEVISNPGASYSASSLGIINIILKRGKDVGLNSSLTLTGGYKDTYGGLLTLNHRTNKFNFFTNTSYFHRHPINLATNNNQYFANGSPQGFLEEKSENDNEGSGIYSTLGFDFLISDNTMVSASLNYQNINNDSRSTTISDFFDAGNDFLRTNHREHLGDFENEVVELQLDIQQKFKKEGQELKLSFTSTSDNESYNNEVTNTDNSFENLSFSEENKMTNKILDLKFTNPISDNASVVIGYQGDFGDIPFRYSDLTNPSLDFSENINSFFIEFEKELDRFYYGLGLRTEMTAQVIDYIAESDSLKKDFDDWFPTVYLEYSLTERSSLSFSYSKKITRPGYLQLNPFVKIISETSIYKGNEQLTPVNIDMYSLTYLISKNRFSIQPSFFFNRYHDYWQNVTYETGKEINGVNQLLTTLENAGEVNYYGLNLSTTLRSSSMASFTGNVLLFNFDQSGTFETINSIGQAIKKEFDVNGFSGTLSLLSQFRFPNLFNLQLSVNHELESEADFSKRAAYSYAGLTITRDLFDSNATLSISSNDLFNSIKTKRDRFDLNFYSKSLIEKKHRKILLSFTYRFNQSKKKREIDFSKKEANPHY